LVRLYAQDVSATLDGFGDSPAAGRYEAVARRAPRLVGPDSLPAALRSPGGASGSRGRPDPGKLPRGVTAAALVAEPAAPYDLPVGLNAHVLRYLAYFLGPGRASYAQWLARSGRFAEVLRREMELRRAPSDLFYLVMIESGFSSVARSPAGAVGLWQFVPRTGRAYGLRIDRWVDERQDPLRCTQAALDHLEDLHQHYGSWQLALAAYNGGIGWVDRAIRRYNSNDLWVLARHDFLPRGMFLYVAKIMAAMLVGHNQAALGFAPVRRHVAPRVAAVPAARGLRLRKLARAVGLKEDALAALNPWLLKRRVPDDGPLPRLVVPAASAAKARRFLAQASAERPVGPTWHTVMLGDSLRGLSRLYGVSATRLAGLNHLTGDHDLLPGRRLLVPFGARRRLGSSGGADGQPLVVVPAETFTYPERELAFFRVPRQGLDAALVAATCGVAVEEIALWNDVDPAAHLYPGMILRLYLPASPTPPNAHLLRPRQVRRVVAGSPEMRAELDARRPRWRPRRKSRRWRYHRVRAGETLESIAARYDLKPDDVARHSGVLATDLRVGRVLRIPRRRRKRGRRRRRRRRRR